MLRVGLLLLLAIVWLPAAEEGERLSDSFDRVLRGEDAGPGALVALATRTALAQLLPARPGPAPAEAPGQGLPAGPAPACAVHLQWEKSHTLIVVGQAVGIRRPAWVVTYAEGSPQWMVAYAATAWTNGDGSLEVAGRQSRVVGPLAGQDGSRYFPDNFRIMADGKVDIIDDQPMPKPNAGKVDAVLSALAAPALHQRLRRLAQALVGEWY